MQHDVKCLPEYFGAVKSGTKKFELRYDDRHYSVGDQYILKSGHQRADIQEKIL